MFAPWRLVVRTAEKTVLEAARVQWIQVQLADGGGIHILPGHAPLLAETVTAPLRYADASGEHSLRIQAGILQIAPGQVTVYTTGRADVGAAAGPSVEHAKERRFNRLAEALLGSPRANGRAITRIAPALDSDDVEEG